MTEVSTKRLAIALILVLGAAAVSGLLLLQHYGEPRAVSAVNQACGDGSTSGCETVAQRSWSAIGGVPLAGIGLAFSLIVASLLALALGSAASTRAALAALVVVMLAAALGIDIVLAGVQAFAVKAFCALCFATYVANAGALAALWPGRHALPSTGAALRSGEGRPAALAAALVTVAWVSTVAAADLGLRARAKVRQGALLGAPAGPPADPHEGHSHAAPPSSPPLDASAGPEQWRAEAQRLQAILDDPQRLDQYFSDKAAREYAQARVEALELSHVPSKGAPGAPVQVVEFSDFLCPFCRNLAGALQGFLPQSGNRLQIFYKNYPLDQSCNPHMKHTAHAGACNLALGALCAHDQGKFWEYHDRVFSTASQSAQVADVVRLGTAVGLDAGAFGTCLASTGARDRLAAEIAEAHRAGVEATPTLFINGKKLPRINDFIQVIDKEAGAKGFPPLKLPNPH